MRIVCTVFLLVAIAACSEDAPPPERAGTAVPDEEFPDSATPRPAISNWNTAAGPVLLVAGAEPQEAIVVLPDANGYIAPDSLDASEHVGAVATLLHRAGVVGTARLRSDPGTAPPLLCNSWPVLLLPPGTQKWTVGFVGGDVAAYRLDSVQAMSRPDSALLVAQVARLASGARINTTGDHAGSFRGLPFFVYEARRFTHDSLDVLVAQVVRRVNQEASPLEEHTLLIAERASAGGQWNVARVEWNVGREESVGRQELLAAVRMRGQPALIFTRDGGSERHYTIHWRGAGSWATRWASAASRC